MHKGAFQNMISVYTEVIFYVYAMQMLEFLILIFLLIYILFNLH